MLEALQTLSGTGKKNELRRKLMRQKIKFSSPKRSKLLFLQPLNTKWLSLRDNKLSDVCKGRVWLFLCEF